MGTAELKLVSVTRAAAMIGISPWTLRRWVRSGDAPAVRFVGPAGGTTWRINVAELERWLADHGTRGMKTVPSEPPRLTRRSCTSKALDIAVVHGGADGGHHKAWVIDQMVRALTGCPIETRTATDVHGTVYTYEAQGESDAYKALVAEAKAGEDGPDTYEWDIGIPP